MLSIALLWFPVSGEGGSGLAPWTGLEVEGLARG